MNLVELDHSLLGTLFGDCQLQLPSNCRCERV